ncbi:uncharacterized protein LOC127548926 [Antechinus flavipes]|uniref:uncharacterized protein LOC127548926 n=1 Tax=Antechinus flavipes TaxID=38775 RepID=UPI002235DE7B|nr:uncharacterized protein LOC127548926 [Antechinus flavipes]
MRSCNMRFTQLLMLDHIPQQCRNWCECGRTFLALSLQGFPINFSPSSFLLLTQASLNSWPPAPWGRGPRTEGGGESNFFRSYCPLTPWEGPLNFANTSEGVADKALRGPDAECVPGCSRSPARLPPFQRSYSAARKKASEQRPRLPRPPLLSRRALFPQPGSRAEARAGRLLLPRFRGSRLGPLLPQCVPARTPERAVRHNLHWTEPGKPSPPLLAFMAWGWSLAGAAKAGRTDVKKATLPLPRGRFKAASTCFYFCTVPSMHRQLQTTEEPSVGPALLGLLLLLPVKRTVAPEVARDRQLASRHVAPRTRPSPLSLQLLVAGSSDFFLVCIARARSLPFKEKRTDLFPLLVNCGRLRRAGC